MIWVKATKDKFEEFGQEITTEVQTTDGDYLKHFELTGQNTEEAEKFLLAIRFKTSFDVLTDEQVRELIANGN